LLTIFIKAHIIQSVNSLTIRAGDKMTIRVNCDLNRMMTELILYIRKALIILNQKRCECMPEIMYPDPPQIRFSQTFEKYALPEIE
jgi:hypothetical protein